MDYGRGLRIIFCSNSAISTASILENNASAYDVEKLELNMQHLIAFKRVNEATLEIPTGYQEIYIIL